MKKQVLLVHNSNHSKHDGKMNECAARVEAITEELQSRGLWEQCRLLDAADFMSKNGKNHEDLLMTVTSTSLYSAAHLESLQIMYTSALQWNCPTCTFGNSRSESSCQVCGVDRPASGVDFVIPEGKSDVYLCQESLSVALANIKACCHAARELQLNPDCLDSVFCLVRPPGHHASSEHYGSYCLINTVAVVAKTMVSTKNAAGSDTKILIVDWDVHHGDGTQALMEQDPVLSQSCRFISVHRHDKDFWPKSGKVHDGIAPSIVNVPLWGVGYGDGDYEYIFRKIIVPLATQFEPNLILVSAGYDCAQGDQLGRFAVTAQGFGRLSRMLLAIAPTVFILEGGYDVDACTDRPHGPLRDGVAATIESLLQAAAGSSDENDIPARDNAQEELSVRDETKKTVQKVMDRLAILA